MTRSMIDTPQRYPRAGSQSHPSPAAEQDADGSTTIYFAPTQPPGVKRGNWIQTMPEKGGSRSCASTARSSRSSRRNGGRARSSWCSDKIPGRPSQGYRMEVIVPVAWSVLARIGAQTLPG